MAGGCSGCSSTVPSLPPPRPKSPPGYPDLYGKRRELAKVQMLEREISFLEGELKYVESLQPASKCCKEVADFVVANSDPFMPISEKTSASCRFWKWLCGPCIYISRMCCFGCTPCIKKPACCNCNCHCNCYICKCPSCVRCSIPKCSCCSCPQSLCCDEISCDGKCCHGKCCDGKCCDGKCCFPRCFTCPDCSCKCRCSSCFKCPKVENPCSGCTKNCCYPCWLCY